MIFQFDVTLHTRPADKQSMQKRTIQVYANSRVEAIEAFWSVLSYAPEISTDCTFPDLPGDE